MAMLRDGRITTEDLAPGHLTMVTLAAVGLLLAGYPGKFDWFVISRKIRGNVEHAWSRVASLKKA